MSDDNLILLDEEDMKSKIYTIRGVQVMIDSDLAEFYKVQTKVLNQSVRRNIKRFPSNFMFQLTLNEFENLRSQIVTSKKEQGGRRYLPFVFTEQGIAMLAGILHSKTAIEISVSIINVFINMKKFIYQNKGVLDKLYNIEKKQLKFEVETDNKFDKIFDLLEGDKIERKQGIFYDGQVFSAYVFVCDLIKKADKSIVLIDNYIDESILTLFCKRKYNVSVVIHTKNISKSLKLDLDKFNSQYEPIAIKEFKYSHDRFMIIDDKEVYHFGASLKDLGKKWFGFSKFDKEAFEILKRLK